jgi:sugar phosphate isomerase/epimerase
VLAAACRWLDTRIITLCTGSRDRADMWKWNIGNVTRESWDVLVAAMKAAVKIADRHEVTLAFEPEIHNVVSSVMRARRLLDEIGSPWLKVVIDPANLIYSGGFGRLQETLDEAFEWLGPDMVLAHAKEPQLADLDETVLTKLGYETMSRLIHAEAPAMNAGDAGDEGPEQLAQRMADHARFTQKLSLAFFYPYFQWLTKIGYRGAIIIHGLEESAVDEQSWFLRKLLNYRSQEGPNE